VNVDSYLTASWRGRNCWHLVQRGWLELTGEDLGDRTPGRMAKDALVSRFAQDVPAFTRLPGPVDPSIVLMQSPGRVPHVGLFFRGRVLQLAGQTVTFLPPEQATTGWPKEGVGYYR
jgi:hypothetical protein